MGFRFGEAVLYDVTARKASVNESNNNKNTHIFMYTSA